MSDLEHRVDNDHRKKRKGIGLAVKFSSVLTMLSLRSSKTSKRKYQKNMEWEVWSRRIGM